MNCNNRGKIEMKLSDQKKIQQESLKIFGLLTLK